MIAVVTDQCVGDFIKIETTKDVTSDLNSVFFTLYIIEASSYLLCNCLIALHC